MDDYHGLDESPQRDALGNIRGNYAGFRVEVDVEYVSAAEVTGFSLDNTSDGKLIVVRVHPPSGTDMAFSAYRGNF